MKVSNLFFKVFFSTMLLYAAVNAAPAAGKVRSALGEVSRLKANEADWSALRVGAKVFHSDKVRTGAESEVSLGLPDGSLITIEEHSEVLLSELLEENGAFKTTIDVKTGRLSFSAQKQGKNSTFQFKTGTATAAIRGTEGSIGESDGVFVAGLRNGALEIETDGTVINIKGGETAFKRKGQKAETLKLASSGDSKFSKKIETLLKDKSIRPEALLKKIRNADSTFQKNLKKVSQGVSCQIESLPDTVKTKQISIKGKCNENVTAASIYGEKLSLSSDGSFTAAITLDTTSIGEKKFKFLCHVGKINFPCGEIAVNYCPEKVETGIGFNITSANPANVCDDGLNIEGSYQTPDPKSSLILSIGSSYKSNNLIKLADGQEHNFSIKVPVSDENSLWEEKSATLEFNSDNWNEKKTIDINVNKSCKAVNRKAPNVKLLSSDSLRCVANVTVSDVNGDVAILTVKVDNSPVSADVLKKDGSKRVTLPTGIHEYEFSVEDQAGNESSIQKTLGCYPAKKFKIELLGQTKETLRIPPPPVGTADILQKELRFKIKLSENDPNYIYKITVKQNGKTILQEQLAQIQSLDYTVPVDLTRNRENVFDIYVVSKSGYKAHAQKVYEVR